MNELTIEDVDVVQPRRSLHPLAGAWLTKARDLDRALRVAASAPALFKPGYVAALEADRADALRWARFWGGQS